MEDSSNILIMVYNCVILCKRFETFPRWFQKRFTHAAKKKTPSSLVLTHPNELQALRYSNPTLQLLQCAPFLLSTQSTHFLYSFPITLVPTCAFSLPVWHCKSSPDRMLVNCWLLKVKQVIKICKEKTEKAHPKKTKKAERNEKLWDLPAISTHVTMAKANLGDSNDSNVHMTSCFNASSQEMP